MALYHVDGTNYLRDSLFDRCLRERRAEFNQQVSGRMVVVGNSEVEKDHSELVDTADCVMRFSKVIHYNTGLLGTRTDILALRASRAFTWDKDTERHDPERCKRYFSNVASYTPWDDCKEVWLAGKYLNYEQDVLPYLEFYPGLAEKPMRMINICPLHDYLFGHYKGQQGPITNGIIMVLHLLSMRPLAQWTIQLVGFKNFRVAPGDIAVAHDVERDKEILRKLCDAGYIELRD